MNINEHRFTLPLGLGYILRWWFDLPPGAAWSSLDGWCCTRMAVEPAAMAAMRATLQVDAAKERGAAEQTEALSALEEELVQRKQKELQIASERQRLQRELAGLSRASCGASRRRARALVRSVGRSVARSVVRAFGRESRVVPPLL